MNKQELFRKIISLNGQSIAIAKSVVILPDDSTGQDDRSSVEQTATAQVFSNGSFSSSSSVSRSKG